MQTSSSRAYTSIVFSFLVVSLFGWYAIRPTIQTILSLQREIKDKTLLDKQMEDKISALIEAQANYQEVEPVLPAVNQALPNSSDALQLAQQLRNAATAVGATMTSIQIPSVPLSADSATPSGTSVIAQKLGVSAASKQTEMTISVTVEGPFSALKAYMNTITQLRRIIAIQGVNVTVNKQTTSAATIDKEATESATQTTRTIELALKLKAYYLAK